MKGKDKQAEFKKSVLEEIPNINNMEIMKTKSIE